MLRSAEPLREPKLKIKRAKQHLGDLEREISRVFGPDSDTCAVIIETDPQTRKICYKLIIKGDIGDDIEVIVGDILQNLRASLDQVVCCLARAHGASTHKLQFPIGETEDVFKSFAGQPEVQNFRNPRLDV